MARGLRKSITPAFRRLRVYAVDPSLATQLETAVVNDLILKVPWEIRPEDGRVEKPGQPPRTAGEKDEEGDFLRPGPVGEYLEVVDYDPATGCFYEPVDL